MNQSKRLMRILLVEDDSRIARFVAKGLREQAYAVDVATNGEDALRQVSINTYDLAILDDWSGHSPFRGGSLLLAVVHDHAPTDHHLLHAHRLIGILSRDFAIGMSPD